MKKQFGPSKVTVANTLGVPTGHPGEFILPGEGVSIVNLWIGNTHATAILNDIQIELKDYEGDDWYPFLGAADLEAGVRTDHLFSTSDLNTGVVAIQPGSRARLHFRANAAWAFRVKLKSDTNGSSAEIGAACTDEY